MRALRIGLLLFGLTAAAAVGVAAGYMGGQARSQNAYLTEAESIEREFVAARRQCAAQAGNAWNACAAQSIANKWRGLADAEVRLRNTAESYRVQRIVQAGAALLVEAQRCGAGRSAQRAACDNAALGSYRQAMAHVDIGSPSAECTLAGCPRQPVLVRVNAALAGSEPAPAMRSIASAER